MMRTLHLTAAMLAATIGIAAFTAPANACVTTTWKKTSGNSFADTIKGRDCGGTMSARFTGGFGDTGWIPMFKNGTSSFMAQYGDGQVLTDIRLQVNGAAMNGSFNHKAASGISFTQGTYHLTSF